MSNNIPKLPSSPQIPSMEQWLQYANLFAQQSNKQLPLPPSPNSASASNPMNSLNPLLQYNMFFPMLPFRFPSPPTNNNQAPKPPSTSHSIESLLSAPQKLKSEMIQTSPSSQPANKMSDVNAAIIAHLSKNPSSPKIPTEIRQSPPPPSTLPSMSAATTPQQQQQQLSDVNAAVLALFSQQPSTPVYRPHPPVLRVHVTRENSAPLKYWFSTHMHDPYPTPQEIESLANITGFSRKQVRDWFTNNRRRYEQKLKSKNMPIQWKKRVSPKISPF